MGNQSKKPLDYQIVSSYNSHHWYLKQQLTNLQIWHNTLQSIDAEVYQLSSNIQISQLDKYTFRYHNNNDIVGVYHLIQQENEILCSNPRKMFVLVERIPFRFDQLQYICQLSTLTILLSAYSGYNTIGSRYGPVMPDPSCICFTVQGKPKVWVNPNLSLNTPLKVEDITDGQELEKRNRLYTKQIFDIVTSKTLGSINQLRAIFKKKQPTYFEAINILENYAQNQLIQIPETININQLQQPSLINSAINKLNRGSIRQNSTILHSQPPLRASVVIKDPMYGKITTQLPFQYIRQSSNFYSPNQGSRIVTQIHQKSNQFLSPPHSFKFISRNTYKPPNSFLDIKSSPLIENKPLFIPNKNQVPTISFLSSNVPISPLIKQAKNQYQNSQKEQKISNKKPIQTQKMYNKNKNQTQKDYPLKQQSININQPQNIQLNVNSNIISKNTQNNLTIQLGQRVKDTLKYRSNMKNNLPQFDPQFQEVKQKFTNQKKIQANSNIRGSGKIYPNFIQRYQKSNSNQDINIPIQKLSNNYKNKRQYQKEIVQQQKKQNKYQSYKINQVQNNIYDKPLSALQKSSLISSYSPYKSQQIKKNKSISFKSQKSISSKKQMAKLDRDRIKFQEQRKQLQELQKRKRKQIEQLQQRKNKKIEQYPKKLYRSRNFIENEQNKQQKKQKILMKEGQQQKQSYQSKSRIRKNIIKQSRVKGNQSKNQDFEKLSDYHQKDQYQNSNFPFSHPKLIPVVSVVTTYQKMQVNQDGRYQQQSQIKENYKKIENNSSNIFYEEIKNKYNQSTISADFNEEDIQAYIRKKYNISGGQNNSNKKIQELSPSQQFQQNIKNKNNIKNGYLSFQRKKNIVKNKVNQKYPKDKIGKIKSNSHSEVSYQGVDNSVYFEEVQKNLQKTCENKSNNPRIQPGLILRNQKGGNSNTKYLDQQNLNLIDGIIDNKLQYKYIPRNYEFIDQQFSDKKFEEIQKSANKRQNKYYNQYQSQFPTFRKQERYNYKKKLSKISYQDLRQMLYD